ASHARIVNNSIYNNHCYALALNALTNGGGLYIESYALLDSVIVKYNEIFDNTLESEYCRGAGIYVSKSFLDLCNNTINNNSTTGTYCYGSAIRLNNIDGEININNNLIYENIHQSEYIAVAVIYLYNVQNADSKVTIKNNSINNNLAIGTGLYLWGTAIWLGGLGDLLVVIDGNIIKDHESIAGCGIRSNSSFNYRLTNNVFKANTVEEYGGAILYKIDSKDKDDIYLFPGQPKPKPVNFKNKGTFRPLIANNTFVGNHAGLLGGAVYLSFTCDSLCPVIINNIFKDNTADSLDFDVHHNGDEELLFSYNNIDLSRISGNWAGTGNIPGDPGFIDTLFHIDEYSLCCGAGINSVLHDEKWYSSPMTDYEGQPRPMPYTYMPDIGADEVDEGTGIPNLPEDQSPISMNIFPNPFSNQTTIEFTLPESELVTLSIFDITGKHLKTILSKKLSKGNHQINWNAEELNEGIYFIRLETNKGIKTMKMIKLK
ncbi:MAG: T9SS type A sorting domain-containing protein, partial [Bacteroidales bacterium]|nr:T9SS type A sorting domain-containing protein [Bacteroidales bacterium]